jgi:hydrogenase expression/formation protein HypC
MCLAMPLQVISIDGARARARSAGVEIEVALDLVEGVDVGDYVLVHAGFAIQVLSAEEAAETLAIIERLEAADRSSR